MNERQNHAEQILEKEAASMWPGSAVICSPEGLPLVVLPDGRIIPAHRRLQELLTILEGRQNQEENQIEAANRFPHPHDGRV